MTNISEISPGDRVSLDTLDKSAGATITVDLIEDNFIHGQGAIFDMEKWTITFVTFLSKIPTLEGYYLGPIETYGGASTVSHPSAPTLYLLKNDKWIGYRQPFYMMERDIEELGGYNLKYLGEPTND